MHRRCFVLLAFCVLASLACKTDEPPLPQVVLTTQPGLTQPPLAGTPEAATPTRTLSPPPTPRPGAPPTPARRPLSFNFGAGVDQGDRSIIVSVLEASRDLLKAAGGGEPPTTVLAHSSITELALTYRRLGPNESLRASDVARRLQSGVAEAGFRNVAIYTGGDFWRGANAVQRAQVIAHEYVHVVQLELMGESRANQLFNARTDSVTPAGPFWLLEGSAELLSWQVMEAIRLSSLQQQIEASTRTASETRPSLAALESFVGFAAADKPGVATAMLGVEFLMRGRQPAQLFRFFEETRVGRDWEDTFRVVFGLTVPEFYDAFQASR